MSHNGNMYQLFWAKTTRSGMQHHGHLVQLVDISCLHAGMLGQKLPRGQHQKHITTEFRNVIVQLHNCNKCHKLLSLGMQCQGEKRKTGLGNLALPNWGLAPAPSRGGLQGSLTWGTPHPP
jgi:hypothetical protein